MAKKQTKTRQSKISLRGKILPILVGLLTIAVIIQSFFIYYLFKQSQVHDNSRIVSLIIQSAESFLRPLPQDPKTGTVFISDAKLTLPSLPANLGPIVYTYEPAIEGSSPVIHLSRQNDINSTKSKLLVSDSSPESTFSVVPKYQSCIRGVQISYDQKEMQQPSGSKVLSNGKTVYFSTEPLCPNEDLLNYAKQIDSY